MAFCHRSAVFFTYKDQSKDVRKIAEEHGVRYVLEGSLRRAGNRLRVTAELVDAQVAEGESSTSERRNSAAGRYAGNLRTN